MDVYTQVTPLSNINNTDARDGGSLASLSLSLELMNSSDFLGSSEHSGSIGDYLRNSIELSGSLGVNSLDSQLGDIVFEDAETGRTRGEPETDGDDKLKAKGREAFSKIFRAFLYVAIVSPLLTHN